MSLYFSTGVWVSLSLVRAAPGVGLSGTAVTQTSPKLAF